MNQNIIDKIEYPQEGILSKEILKNETNDITLFCMAKDTKISEHTSSMSGLVYVVEGDGVFNLQGEDVVMTTGKLIFMEKNAKHSLKAIEKTSFLLIMNKNKNIC